MHRDQPAIPTTAIPTLLPPVTLGFRQFWLAQACVGIAGVGIAVCTPMLMEYLSQHYYETPHNCV